LSEGIKLSGTNITVERTIVRDNGSDAIQSDGGGRNFTLRQSWLAIERTAPDDKDAFNRCTHNDGIQIHNGGSQSGVTIEDSVIGPGFLQGVLLGEPGRATINDVFMRNTLFFQADNANIHSHKTKPKNWRLEHVTSYREAGAKNHNIVLQGHGHTIRNSIFVGGRSMAVGADVHGTDNCLWDMEAHRTAGGMVNLQSAT